MSVSPLPDSTAQDPLLAHDAVDYSGRPVHRSSSGGWRAASFIIGVEVAERFAFCGISSNLMSYLTGPLGQSTVKAAENVNAWSGMASMLPLVGALVADSFLGRYRTIVLSSALYALGLGLLTVSALLPSVSPDPNDQNTNTTFCAPPQFQAFFFFTLYLVAFAQGGHRPCVQAFGADQFDGRDPDECKAKSSFFNWWNFSQCAGSSVILLVFNYIQYNISWGIGYGIPCVSIVLASVIFLLGTKTYRYSIKGDDEKNPFMRICQVFLAAARNWRTTPLAINVEEEAGGSLLQQGSHQFKFLNKALLAPGGLKEDGKVCSISEVEEAKAVLRLVPIWATCLVYAIVFAQPSTFFIKQGLTLDKSIGSNFEIPAASLQSFIGFSVAMLIPIYGRVIVPIARSLTGKPSGITMLQRIGIGMFVSIISMIIAALVEMKRLRTAQEHGLVDAPEAIIPMSIWWLVPQCVLFGVADVFTLVGLQEFFYDQVPDEIRTVGVSLYLSIFGMGSFLSTSLISVIEKATGGEGQDSWFADNLNRAHLDYFYCLLIELSALALIAYMYFAKSYTYKN